MSRIWSRIPKERKSRTVSLRVFVSVVLALAVGLSLFVYYVVWLQGAEKKPVENQIPFKPQSVTTYDAVITLMENALIWTCNNTTFREGDPDWDWDHFGVEIDRNNSTVQWGLDGYRLSRGVPATVDFGCRTQMWYPGEGKDSLDNRTLRLTVTDLKGNGVFDFGDSMVITTVESRPFTGGPYYFALWYVHALFPAWWTIQVSIDDGILSAEGIPPWPFRVGL